MKLQKRLGRKYNDKEYHKWIVVLSHELIIDSGFKEGEDLRAEAQDGKITLTRRKQV